MESGKERRVKRSGELTSISTLLARYRDRIRPPQASVEQVVITVVAEVTGHTLRSDQVSYTVATRTLAFRVPSILKTELLTHRSTIQRGLKDRLGVSHAPEVLL